MTSNAAGPGLRWMAGRAVGCVRHALDVLSRASRADGDGDGDGDGDDPQVGSRPFLRPGTARSPRPDGEPDFAGRGGAAPTPFRSARRGRMCGGAPTGRRRPAEPATTIPTSPGPASAWGDRVAVVPAADEDGPAGYPLRSRCRWCREPIGWDHYVGLWVHLGSDRVRCRNRIRAWAAADPEFTTITRRPPLPAWQPAGTRAEHRTTWMELT